MKITVTGMGYVGLVTAACFAEIGHDVTCFDTDLAKIKAIQQGQISLYEPGLSELIIDNLKRKRLAFTADPTLAYHEPGCIFLTVGTPNARKGGADLTCIYDAVKTIKDHLKINTILAVKSTVPIGTCDKIKSILSDSLPTHRNVKVVSNPEFLREGSGIYDTFHADRILIGTDDEGVKHVFDDIYKPFNVPMYFTDIRSAELTKYASNAFLATKISFINEIANICEKVGADIEEVAIGMGLDKRIGSAFLRAGIGYGGSCFPKDTLALDFYSENIGYQFEILKGTMRVNQNQIAWPIKKLKMIYPSLKGVEIAILGLSFKPETDDLRGAPSIQIINHLNQEGARITIYDPIAKANFNNEDIHIASTMKEAISEKQAALILTEWTEIRETNLKEYKSLMRTPIVIDGRNCYSLQNAEESGITYYSVGRREINPINI